MCFGLRWSGNVFFPFFEVHAHWCWCAFLGSFLWSVCSDSMCVCLCAHEECVVMLARVRVVLVWPWWFYDVYQAAARSSFQEIRNRVVILAKW